MKILYITRKYPPMVGGMESFSYNLYNNFDKKDADVTLVSLGKKQINLIWFVPYVFFRTLFTASKYDVIFIGDAVLSIVGFFTKLFYPKKTVVVNVFGLDITFKNKIYQIYLKLFYNKFDKYISISRETDNILHQKTDCNSVIITPGIEAAEINAASEEEKRTFRKKYGISENDLVLVTVGRLVRRKGVLWFTENVMPMLKGKNVKYLVVGGGEDKELIEAAVGKLDLSSEVKLLGRVSDEELSEVYKCSDVFVMPNIHVENDMEGFGIVAAEASMHGLIVTASGIEGIKDAIIDGKNGFLLESGNAEQYYEKITDIAAHLSDYKAMTRDFSEFTQVNYNWKHICSQYIDLFKNLIEDKN